MVSESSLIAECTMREKEYILLTTRIECTYFVIEPAIPPQIADFVIREAIFCINLGIWLTELSNVLVLVTVSIFVSN